MTTHPDPGNGPVDRIPLTGRLTVATSGFGRESASEQDFYLAMSGNICSPIPDSRGLFADFRGLAADLKPASSTLRADHVERDMSGNRRYDELLGH